MLAFATPVPTAAPLAAPRSGATSPRRAPARMGGWKEGEKDEYFRKQQEILERRRNKKANADYFKDVETRREEVEEYFDNRTLKVPVGEDPIVAWQKMKDAGYIDEAGYTEDDEGGIPIPMASFGIPKYDRGGRFDLKLPHVEVGYTDEDADVMAKAANAFKNMFGFGKKKDDDATQANEQTHDSDAPQK